MSNFSALKKQLNSEQRVAVETIEGPVMVLAGPGTGKTQVVAMRIGEILQRTQINPNNILALTFTEAGVRELRSRLAELIGPDGYRVTVQTFHGFASEVINSFPHVFKRTRELTQLNDISRFTLIDQLLADHPEWTLLRPLKAPTKHIKEISGRIAICKQEAITSNELRQFAKSESAAAAAEKNKIKREQRRNQADRVTQFAEFLAAYGQKLTTNSQYDFDDMILFVIEAMESNAEVRAFFQEKYQYLLVDEYQDTNNAQNRLIELLADFFPNPNLCVVGDDKQAIFRFQGASVANLLHFSKKYPSLKVIELKKNYRSSPEILAAATKLIEQSHTQIGQFIPNFRPELTAVTPHGTQPVLARLASSTLQWQYLVDVLKKSRRAGTPWSEMAVLVRSNSSVVAFARYAEQCGVPLDAFTAQNITTEPIIRWLIQSLQAIARPTDDQALYRLVRLLLPSESLLELLTIQQQAWRDRQPFINALHATTATQPVAQTIIDWHQKIDTISIVELILEVISQSQIVKRFNPDNEINYLELLRIFVGLADEFSASTPHSTIDSFLRSIETMAEHNIGVGSDTIIASGAGVHVSTLHKAKGLEFEIVLLADASEQSFKIRADRHIIPLPSSVGLKNWQDDAEDDERRLFYVGMTRAKRQLYITYAHTTTGGDAVLPCQFTADCGDTLTHQEPHFSERAIEAALKNSVAQAVSAPLRAQELSHVREQIHSQALSASALHAYQVCPRQFLLSQVLRLPTPNSPAQEYGTAIHSALEQFGRLQKGIKTLPSAKQLLHFFTDAVNRHVQPNERLATLLKGQTVLRDFYEKILTTSARPEAVEYNFSVHHVMLGDIPLTGKVDRIELVDGKSRAVRFVDYKTSAAKTRNDIEGLTKTSDGALKQQLVFYALLASLDRQFPYQVVEHVIQFVDDKQTFRREAFIVTQTEIAELKKTIKKTYHEILTRTEFTHVRELYDKGCEICDLFPNL